MSSRRLQVVLELDTGRYSGRLNAAGTQLKVFSGEVNSGSRSVRQLERSFNTLSSRMSTPLQKLRDYVLILSNVRLAILNVRDIAVGWVGSLLKQSAEVQRLTILMKGLSTATTEFGKNKEAEENLTRLFKMARENGFQVKQLADAFIKLKTGGIDPMNGSLQALTDAVARFGGDSDVMHRASVAIQQMAGKGVISMEELRQQLGEAVPTAMWDMARAAGMSLQKFTNLVSKGVIQAKPALALMFQEFERMYSGSGKLMGQTLMGQIEQFKTNVTQLATSFTGMASGQTDTLQAYMAEQRQLLKDGKITVEEFERSTQGGGGAGMFAGATEALKEINEAMQSGEAKVAMQDLGAAINSVMQGLISAGRFVVEWRDEIMGAAKGILYVFGAVKAIQLGKWLFSVGQAAKASFLSILNVSQPLPGAIGSAERATRNWAAATQQSIVAHNAKIAALGRQTQMMTTLFASTQRRIAQLQQERVQLQAQLQTIALQRQQQMANLRTAEALHAANVAMGRDATRSSQMVSAAAKELGATRRWEARVNELLITTEKELVVAQQQARGAAVVTAAAQAELTAATTASTFAMRVGAVAAKGASVAVSFLGRAMSVALGPIGMIALALYEAANAAGYFENKADKAAAAAARLMQGMADLEDMKSVIAQKKRNEEEFTRVSDQLNSGKDTIITPEGVAIETGLSQKKRAELMKRRKELYDQNQTYREAIKRGSYALKVESVDQAFAGFDQEREGRIATQQQDYRSAVASGKYTDAQLNAMGDKITAKNIAYYDDAITRTTAKRDAMKAAKQDTTAIDMLIGKLTDAKKAFQDMHQPTAQLQADLIGVGKGGKGAHHKLTDAEKAAKKAAKEFENAREKYDRLLDGQEGEIASLEEQLAGGDKKGTAKFEALKEAGFYADATNEELERMAKNFARIDQLNEQINFEKSLGSLKKALSQTATEATQLWSALRSGSYETFTRDAQVRSQFANLLDGVTDPAEIEKINNLIDQVVTNIKRADAAEVAHSWIQMSEDIEASLLTENDARQRMHDLEMQRAYQRIDWAKLEGQARIDALDAWKRYSDAKNAELARANESGLIKMSRDWAKLGSNIDAVFTDAAKSMVDMIADGEGNMLDFAETIMKQLFKVILQAIIAYAILSAIGQTNGMSFSQFMQNGLKNFAGGFAPQAAAPTKHKGGMIGGGGALAMVGAHLWNNAQTRHNGGWIGGRALKKGEVPIVGMEKELVLTEEQQRLLGQQISGGPGGVSPPSVAVNIINNSGTDVDAQHGEPEWNGKEYVLSIVMEAANKQGPFRDMLQNTGKK